jgi:outer membrane protein assembly factor BamB
MNRAFVVLTLVVSFAAARAMAADNNWPQFRGPGSRGVSDNERLPDKWSAEENVLWKRDIPGRGWSSPIVWGNRVFLTTAVNQGESEEPRKGLYFGGNRPEPPKSIHERWVYCLDLSSGDVLWKQMAHEGVPESPTHLKNSYASETPVTDGQRLYAYFGNLGLFCYDLEGKPVWSKLQKPLKTRFGWGTAASPVLHEGKLFIVNDNDEESYLLALDAKTGDELWRVARDEKSNWSTPYVWRNERRIEIVVPGSGKTRSYDLEGSLLWELGGASGITIATPYSAFDLLYVSSGYVMDSKKPLFAVRPGAAGDISLQDDATKNEHVAWCQKTAAPYNPSTVVYGDYLYTLLDGGFFACYDARTGEEVYGKQRLGRSRGFGGFTASPWAYGGKVFCLDEDGVTTVVKAGKEFEILHTNALAEDDMGMATPALAGDKLLIRTAARVYCIARP